MPSSVVRSFAPKYAEKNDLSEKKAVEKLERLWERAKKIAKKQEDLEEESDQFYAYVMGIWKRMVGFDDAKEEAEASNMVQITISFD